MDCVPQWWTSTKWDKAKTNTAKWYRHTDESHIYFKTHWSFSGNKFECVSEILCCVFSAFTYKTNKKGKVACVLEKGLIQESTELDRNISIYSYYLLLCILKERDTKKPSSHQAWAVGSCGSEYAKSWFNMSCTSSLMSSCCCAVKISIAPINLIINSSTVELPEKSNNWLINHYATRRLFCQTFH